jgi:hypothetical protein
MLIYYFFFWKVGIQADLFSLWTLTIWFSIAYEWAENYFFFASISITWIEKKA